MANENMNIIDRKQFGASTIEIVEYTKLNGASNSQSAERLFYLGRSGVTLKMVRINLGGNRNEVLKTESGALYYYKGNIQTSVPTSGITGRVIKSKLTGEATFMPEYIGSGMVVLEPSFKHYKIVKMNNASFTVAKGSYYCSLGNIDVEPITTGSTSASVLGGDGFVQTRVRGTGLVVLNIPVPENEIESYTLNNETMKIDGNFFILRDSRLKYSISTSTSGLMGTLVSNEGILMTLQGTGMVWLAPTAPVYDELTWSDVSDIQNYGTGNTSNKQNLKR